MKTAFGFVAVVALVASFALILSSDRGPEDEPAQLDDVAGIYDPVRAGEETPDGFSQLLRRDAIHPVYEPEFRSAATTDWSAETLVIGLELDGEAKAYPLSFLNHREMVIDWIGGTPVLVSW